LQNEPTKLRAGDTATWTRSDADYPATDGWTLSYFFSLGTEAPQKVDATPAGADYTLTLTADVTAPWSPVTCHWLARVAKSGEVHTVDEGSFDVLPNPTGAYDRRTHAEKCLAAITAVIEGQMGDPIVEYEIDGVKAKKLPHDQLVKLRAHYQGVVRRQKGGGLFRTYPVRFWP
jgi:hypothetical protein